MNPHGCWVSTCFKVTQRKEEYASTLQAYFIFSSTMILIIQIYVGNVTAPLLKTSGIALLGVTAGTALGSLLFQRLNIRQLQRAVYLVMMFMGISLMLAG